MRPSPSHTTVRTGPYTAVRLVMCSVEACIGGSIPVDPRACWAKRAARGSGLLTPGSHACARPPLALGARGFSTVSTRSGRLRYAEGCLDPSQDTDALRAALGPGFPDTPYQFPILRRAFRGHHTYSSRILAASYPPPSPENTECKTSMPVSLAAPPRVAPTPRTLPGTNAPIHAHRPTVHRRQCHSCQITCHPYSRASASRVGFSHRHPPQAHGMSSLNPRKGPVYTAATQ